jgi:hypothetical protein
MTTFIWPKMFTIGHSVPGLVIANGTTKDAAIKVAVAAWETLNPGKSSKFLERELMTTEPQVMPDYDYALIRRGTT